MWEFLFLQNKFICREEKWDGIKLTALKLCLKSPGFSQMHLLFSKLTYPILKKKKKRSSGNLGNLNLLLWVWLLFGHWRQGILAGLRLEARGWCVPAQSGHSQDSGSLVMRAHLVPPLHFPGPCITAAHIHIPYGLCNLQILQLSSHYRPGGTKFQS